MQAFFLPGWLAIAGIVLSASVAGADGAREANATVVANVGPLRAARGAMACRIYRSPEGFPRTAVGTTSMRVKVTGTGVRCTFSKLLAGTYAIMVHHDENDNGKFDTNLLGMPLEGYGASNNHTHALSAPTWEESKFAVERGKTRELAINVRY